MIIVVLTLIFGVISTVCDVIQTVMLILDHRQKNEIYPYLH